MSVCVMNGDLIPSVIDHWTVQILRERNTQLKFVSGFVQLPSITLFVLGQFAITAAHHGRL